MWVHPDLDIQIAWRAAIPPRLALTRQAYAVTIVDTGGHFDRKRFGFANAPAAMAIATWIADRRAGAFTRRASLLDGEEALLHANLANATTRRALNGLGAFLGTAAIAGLAGNLGWHVNRHRVTADGFLKIESQLVSKIGTTKHLAASLPAAAKNIAEHVAEDIAEALGAVSARTATAR
jgi:hypothetical protein